MRLGQPGMVSPVSLVAPLSKMGKRTDYSNLVVIGVAGPKEGKSKLGTCLLPEQQESNLSALETFVKEQLPGATFESVQPVTDSPHFLEDSVAEVASKYSRDGKVPIVIIGDDIQARATETDSPTLKLAQLLLNSNGYSFTPRQIILSKASVEAETADPDLIRFPVKDRLVTFDGNSLNKYLENNSAGLKTLVDENL